MIESGGKKLVVFKGKNNKSFVMGEFVEQLPCSAPNKLKINVKILDPLEEKIEKEQFMAAGCSEKRNSYHCGTSDKNKGFALFPIAVSVSINANIDPQASPSGRA